MKFSKDLFSSRNLYNGFLHIAVVILAIQVIVLAQQNNELKTSSNKVAPELLKEGEQFYYGELISLKEGSMPDTLQAKQLVFVFTTRCTFCQESIPLWKHILKENDSRYSILGISLDPLESTAAYVTENDINFPVFVPKNIEWFVKQVKSTAVPKTILRTNEGLVEKFILGKLNEDQVTELIDIDLAVHN